MMKEIATRINLTFVVFGDFAPQELSSRIGIVPTNTWNKGDEIVIPGGVKRTDGRTRLRQESAWEYSTGFVQTLDLEDLTSQIERQLENYIEEISQYIRDNALDCSMNVVVQMDRDQLPGMHFTLSFLQMVTRLDCEIDVDMYLLEGD